MDDGDFGLNNQKKGARGGGKNVNTTKKDAKSNKHKTCYNSKHIRKIESRALNKKNK
jgi:hypothetical protein